MNICFNIGTLSYSGAEKIMFHLIKKFRDNGDNVSVILESSDAPCDNLDGVTQYPIYGLYNTYENRVKKTIVNHNIIRNIIKNGSFDCVISFGAIYNIDLAEACFFNRVKLVLCERNDPIYDPKSRLLRFRRAIAYRRGNAFVFQTEVIKNYFPNSIRKKAFVIPNFIETKVLHSEQYAPICDSFATAARLDDYQKDQSTLIKAFAQFKKTHKNYKLEFYGDGPDRDKLLSLAESLRLSDSISFWGKVSSPMKKIRHTRGFILSSKYEGMPNSLVEAMAYGIPCISTRCSGGGAEAIICNGQNGLLVDVGDIDGLVDAMCKLADNAELAKSIGEEAAKINEYLSLNRIFMLWCNTVKRVVIN